PRSWFFVGFFVAEKLKTTTTIITTATVRHYIRTTYSNGDFPFKQRTGASKPPALTIKALD
ncbi:MAG TPA: hypothetical protein VHP38_09835, partial [Ruminiclostridium sp.]|nr:hypothetical protein [Ruminiclostridium sp.]